MSIRKRALLCLIAVAAAIVSFATEDNATGLKSEILSPGLTGQCDDCGCGFSFKYDGVVVRGSGSVQIDPSLKVVVDRTAYREFDAEEWVLWFENASQMRSGIISDINDIDSLVRLPPSPTKFKGDCSVPGERVVVTMNGVNPSSRYSFDDEGAAKEFAPVPHYFHPRAPKSFAVMSRAGCPSDGECPFFDIDQDGEGVVVALGWTGGWKASFDNEEDGVRVHAGLCETRFLLLPGERLRTCRVLLMRHKKGEDCSNKFRRLIRSHFSHVASNPAAREGLFACELWGGLPSTEMMRRVRAFKDKGFAFEDWWIDAGWYGSSTKCDDAFTGDWPRFVGDWYVNGRIHPNGMKDVGRAAKEAGGGVMLWFEPERVMSGTIAEREKSAWLIDRGMKSYKMLDYGSAEARKYIADLVSEYAKTIGLSCYRQDMNFKPGAAFKAADGKDRVGVSEIRHVMGLYEVWDEILRRNPGIVIDNCASGGRRLDLETLRRSVFFFRSDYQCAFNANPDVVQAHNANLSRFVPYSGCTTKASDLYSLRSAYASSHGVAYWNAAFQKEENVDWSMAKKSHDEYLRIRRFFPLDFHNHGSASADPTAWAIWQYHDPKRSEGVVLAFRRLKSPCSHAGIELKWIPKGAVVDVENLDSGEKTIGNARLEIVLPESRSSTVLLYRVKQGESES